jgi:membrane-associated protease RseP (regulator of RpoE activity)
MEFRARIAATSLVLLGLTGCAAAPPKPPERAEAPAQAPAARFGSEERFAGIGAAMRKADGKILVEQVFPGSPAAGAGIVPGDVVEKVNGADVGGKELPDVVRLIRGEKGTTVELATFRPSTGARVTRALTRAEIVAPREEGPKPIPKQSAVAGAYRDRATAKLFAEADFLGAVADFSTAIGFAPSDAGLYVGRGIANLKAGNRKAAKDDFDKAASLDGTLGPSLASLLESRPEGVKP